MKRAAGRGRWPWWVGGMLAVALAVAAGTYFGARRQPPGPRGAVPGGLAGTHVLALAVDPENPALVLAGTRDGVYRSEDFGLLWRRAGLAGEDATQISWLPDEPGVVWVAARGGPAKSQDGGRSFFRPGPGDLPSAEVRAVTRPPGGPRTLFAWVQGYGLFRSEDEGATWTRLPAPPSERVTALLAVPGDGGGVRLFAATADRGVLRLDGQAWKGAARGISSPTVFGLAVSPRDPATLWAAAFGGGVYVSRDGGARWSPRNTGLGERDLVAVAVAASEPDTVYVASSGGALYLTRDGGASWRPVTAGGAMSPDELEARTHAVAKKLSCPVCEGQSVADSPSPIALQMRAVVRQKLAAGESEGAILRYFADRYGVEVLMSPPARGFYVLTWAGPLIALAAGAGVLYGYGRARRRPGREVGRGGPEEGPSGDDG